jgi:uncharacterized protein
MPKRWLTDPAVNAAFLDEAPVGRLGLCRDSQPYIVPLLFAFSGDRFYVHTGRTGLKMEHLQANDRVCFEVDRVDKLALGVHPCAHSLRYTSVIANGRARIVTDPEQRLHALRLLTQKYAPDLPAGEMIPSGLAAVEVIEIVVEQLTAKRNVDPQTA